MKSCSFVSNSSSYICFFFLFSLLPDEWATMGHTTFIHILISAPACTTLLTWTFIHSEQLPSQTPHNWDSICNKYTKTKQNVLVFHISYNISLHSFMLLYLPVMPLKFSHFKDSLNILLSVFLSLKKIWMKRGIITWVNTVQGPFNMLYTCVWTIYPMGTLSFLIF